MHDAQKPLWDSYLQRYRGGEWRAPIFRDMVLDDASRMNSEPGTLVYLDIGCGCGFDGSGKLQQSLAAAAGRYVGIEPDAEVALGESFHQTHRCMFEDAPIAPASVDIAFAVMVLEHFENPQLFWDKVHTILRPGGVFWGFTVDARHWFVGASLLADRLHIKERYLNMLHGKRGVERYENYGVYYKSNTPEQIASLTGSFSSVTCLNFYRVGQTDFYFPAPLRWMPRLFDRLAIRMGLPGSILAVRVVK